MEEIRVVGHLAEPKMAVVREQVCRICFGTPSGSTSQIETLFNNARLLQRFLNKAYFALENSDYRRIRDFLGLKPRTDSIVQDDITCDCDDHKATRTESEVFYDPDIMRTWSRIMHCCALREADNIPPSTLDETIRILGFQRTHPKTLLLTFSWRCNLTPRHQGAMLYRYPPHRTSPRHHRKLHARL